MTTFYSLILVHSLMQTPVTTALSPPKAPTNPITNGNGAAKAPTSDAEKIANARDSIKQATEAIRKIQSRLTDPDGEYQKAEQAFEELNTKLKNLKATATRLRKEAKDAEAEVVEGTLKGVEEDWQLAKERFDIAIRQRKASQDAIAGLQERITTDQQALSRLERSTPPPAPATIPPAIPSVPNSPTPPANVTPSNSGAPSSIPQAMPAATPAVQVPPPPEAAKPIPTTSKTSTAPALTTTEPVAAEATPAAKAVASPLSVVMPGLPAVMPTATTTTLVAPKDALQNQVENDAIVLQAREKLELQRTDLHEIEERVRLAETRVRAMERMIQIADQSLQLAQESVAQTEREAAKISNTLDTNPPADPTERDALADKLGKTMERMAESRSQVQRISDRVSSLNETLVGLKAEFDVVKKEADESKKRVAESEAELSNLLSPTAPRNMFRWLILKGPRLSIIIVGMIIVHLIVRQFSRHFVKFITRNGRRGSPEDRENRAHTLVGVFRYSTGLIVLGGGLVMLLDEMGVPIVPLMGGAAVVGLAVAFGAQNLMRDYFTGFMMLMEDQYSVNDVVRIGAIAGLVEQITLRMTVLRDLEGIRHFIPHGTITSVSNLTHGWSRAMMDVPVAYKENVDRVIEELMQLGRDLRLDPKLGKFIMDDPEMLGVDALADSGVVIKFLLKTRPLQQWPVKREMLRRIKNRFDEIGIEIPFPHRTVYHRFPDAVEGGKAMLPMNMIRAAG